MGEIFRGTGEKRSVRRGEGRQDLQKLMKQNRLSHSEAARSRVNFRHGLASAVKREWLALGWVFVSIAGTLAAEPVRFGREVLPILSENCLSCHGADEANRKAGLRLDQREGALALKEGVAAVVPFHPEASELLKRITSRDPEEMMPTPKSHKAPLPAAQVEILRRWIAEGAPWGKHWAFERPRRMEPPGDGTVANPVDRWVQAEWKRAGIEGKPPADPAVLLRRVSFDLTGLPPTRTEREAYLADRDPGAWERVVERLLDSPHFGERMAMWWLDVARYADTDGFQSDATRTNWPWRDWVVSAFNRNQSFDAFTLEQFAGDLLPNASPEQRMATCFHRNHMANGEGGRDPEESRVDYVIDRVNTMGTAWLGLTLGCTQCHTHKFDPISHGEYYGLSAFFNSIDETGAAGGGAKPFMEYHSPHAEAAVAEAERIVSEAKQREAAAREEAHAPFRQVLPGWIERARRDFRDWTPLLAAGLETAEGTVLVQEADASVVATGPHPLQDEYRLAARVGLARVTGLQLEVLPEQTRSGGKLSRGKSGEFILTDLKLQVRQHGRAEVRDIKVAAAVADFSADKKANGGYGEVKDTLDDDPRNGWSTKGAPPTEPHVAVFRLAEPLVLEPEEELVVELRQRSTLGDANISRFRLSVSDQLGEVVSKLGPGPLSALARSGAASEEEIPEDLRKRLFEQFLEEHPAYLEARQRLALAGAQLAEAKAAAGNVKVLVLGERKEPRDTFVLLRGIWDKHGDRVDPGVPAAIAPWPQGEPKNRLGLARWLVSPENPLTARVVVNQLWQLLFGDGLVRTPEDFGVQGERPTHPELLDWLAVAFVESGWDVKRLLKLLATSETYRQSSNATAGDLARDPQNRLLARGARYRLPSWMLRDAALRASGLLEARLGGPPVRPYQPAGVWEELFMGRFKYEPSLGPSQYRRTLYAFWRRAIAPTFLFDNAQRRVCEVRSHRTNTPLQALTLLNDETFREAARVLGAHALQQGGVSKRGRLEWLSLAVLSRAPRPSEWPVLEQALEKALAHYRRAPDDAKALLASGQAPLPPEPVFPEVAAYSVAASLLFNLDEALTHE